MTEEEAKTKWCPMVRIGEVFSPHDSIAINRDGSAGIEWMDHNYKCIASDCMMWRKDNDIKEPCGIESYQRDDGQYSTRTAYKIIKTGHCGLAK